MKHLADFFPLRGGEASVHVLQRARTECFDLGKIRLARHTHTIMNAAPYER